MGSMRWQHHPSQITRWKPQLEAGVQDIFAHPWPHLSAPWPAYRVYPHLPYWVEINCSNQVWGTDITYIPKMQGFMDLVAIMDWCGWFLLYWELSNTLDVGLCLVAPEGGTDAGEARDLQQRPRGTIHVASLHRQTGGCWSDHQYGWSREGI